MIPIRLEIEGLYSYREKQVIEFETLTAAGLFGIFWSSREWKVCHFGRHPDCTIWQSRAGIQLGGTREYDQFTAFSGLTPFHI